MARPRVFISSSFYDLKHVRSTLEVFIGSLGFDPVLSEKGSIVYSPDVALDESCYREAKACDIFVLIVGGRYGSEASESSGAISKDFYDRYESITRKEYESARDAGIPSYILIEKNVMSEYETFKRNRDNTSIKYAHVDSVNIFGFIDYLVTRPKNNPIFNFEFSSEISTWLREQWAGLFRELIRTRTDRNQITSLAAQVQDLSNVSETLKRYLEEVVSRVGNKEEAKEIIGEEQAKLTSSRILAELAKLGPIRDLREMNVSTEQARDIFASATTLDDLAKRLEAATGGAVKADVLIPHWKAHHRWPEEMNEIRSYLDLPALSFSEEPVTTKRPRKKP
jgi:hypothetical protein